MRRLSLKHTFSKLPPEFYSHSIPEQSSRPKLISFNEDLSKEIGLDDSLSEEEIISFFSGNQLPEDSLPISLNYAGHQFGHFNPQLGDGRAVLLGESLNKAGDRFDIQLKGSGQTKYSRRGDGKSPLGPVLREYLLSEAMNSLGVPTTRSLAAVTTGDLVYRETPLPGAILTRVAKSHIRIGTFEYFSARKDYQSIKTLADYSIERLYPSALEDENPYFSFFQKVSYAQVELITKWMRLGFIHGVMNTDNTAISGETIDYGPCAFMDQFNFNQVFSSIDRDARYAYSNQGPVILWNLEKFALCLLPLISESQEKAQELIQEELSKLRGLFQELFQSSIANKLGINTTLPQDRDLITSWFQYLQNEKLDFTQSFRALASLINNNEQEDHHFKQTQEFENFKALWLKRVQEQNEDTQETINRMNRLNPIYIPRNHIVEKVIELALNDDFSLFHEFKKVLKTPFTKQDISQFYEAPPTENEKVLYTFCGT